MKLLIAFALLTVAFADEIKVVDLPPFEPSPILARADIRQLIIPNDVMEAIKNGDMSVLRNAPLEPAIPEAAEELRVRFVDAPLDAPVEADVAQYDEGIEVHFVDGPIDYAAPVAEEIAIEPVVLGEAPMPALEASEDVAVEAVRIAEPSLPAFEEMPAIDAVKFVDSLLEEAAPVAEEIYVPEPVRIAEAPLPAVETPEIAAPAVDAVKFVDSPLEEVAPVAEEIYVPEPVRIAEAPLPAVETPEIAAPAVEPVKIAAPRFPIKQFPDPRWR